ncbi:MAG: hypothetical protein ACRDD7_00210 [Peptostreptococcaceae bacterium]
MNNDNLGCKEYKVLPPVYLKIRLETLIHLNILTENDDPSTLETLNKLKASVVAYVNNVQLPFIRLHDHEDVLDIDIASPCNDGTFIKGSVAVVNRLAYAAGTFAPVLFHATKGLLAGEREFLGLDQLVEVFLPGQHPGDDEHYDIKVILTVDGDTTQISPTGYDLIQYAPDPIGNLGTFFFRCMPAAHIVDAEIHN